MSERDTITPKQRAAIRALLAGKTQQDAAESVGVRPNTVSEWMRDPVFLAELHEAEAEAREEITRALLAEGIKSINTLTQARDDTAAPIAVRVRAATAILDRILRMTELVQLEQRIADLEAGSYAE